MDLLQFKNLLFKRAAKEGFKEYELYYTRSENFSVTVFEGEIDKYSLSNTMGAGFRALINEKMGYAYTEKFDDEGITFLINCAADNAANINCDEKEFIYNRIENYEDIGCYNEGLSTIPPQKKISLALELEKQARGISERVVSIGYCGVSNYTEERGIFNSYGIEALEKNNFIFAAVTPVIKAGENMYNDMAYRITDNFDSINAAELAQEAVREAEGRIGGETISSGKYKVILRNDVAAELLKTFSGFFCADNVQKGLSLYKDKEGSKIASEKITLLDEPLMKNGLGSCSFDGEGFATYNKEVIKDGRLIGFLHNLKTAAIAKTKSTGNASRPSYSSTINAAPTNFYLKSGETQIEELLKEVKEGVFITDIAGVHSGANAITGEFSLAAKGYIIKGGALDKPVEQITISGNFYELLKNVSNIGNDLKFIMPSSSGYYGSPSLLINEISIAGK